MLTRSRKAKQILKSFITPRIGERLGLLSWMHDQTLSLIDRFILFYLQTGRTEQKYMPVNRTESLGATKDVASNVSTKLLRCGGELPLRRPGPSGSQD